MDTQKTNTTLDKLLVDQKKKKRSYHSSVVIVTLMIGLAIFSYIKKGFTFSTLVPLVFLGLTIKTKIDYNSVTKAIKYLK